MLEMGITQNQTKKTSSGKSSRLFIHTNSPHIVGVPRSLVMVSFDLVEQFTSQGRARPAFLGQPLSGRGLETEDAVLSSDIAGDSDATFPGVGRRCAPSRDRHTSTPLLCRNVLNRLLCGGRVAVEGSLGGSAVTFHGVGRSTVTSVGTAVLAQELVVRRVGLVPCSARERVGHGESSRHCCGGAKQYRDSVEISKNSRNETFKFR